MKSRHYAREVALQILYRVDVSKDVDSNGDIEEHFRHFNVHHSLQKFVTEQVRGTLTHQTQIDVLLEKHASNWKVSRMGSIDRCLLRMSVYEMNSAQKTDTAVIIDEAIELAKQFGTAESPAFINGILDAVKNEKIQISENTVN